jgi:hypothetical protein
MSDNRETLAQAMYGKSEEDLEAEEARELTELAGRGKQGVPEATADVPNTDNVSADAAQPVERAADRLGNDGRGVSAEDLHQRGQSRGDTNLAPTADQTRQEYPQ